MRAWVVVLSMLVTGCGGELVPASFDVAHEPCRYCRMVGSTGRFAAQVVAPGQDALYFDDIGCLLEFNGRIAGAEVYVADHRTGRWVPARQAVFVKQQTVETPMGSHLMAFESIASRDADPAAAHGAALTFAEVFSGTGVGS